MYAQTAISLFSRTIHDFPPRFLELDVEKVRFRDREFAVADIGMRTAAIDAAERTILEDTKQFGPCEAFDPFVEFKRCGYTMTWPGRQPVRREMVY